MENADKHPSASACERYSVVTVMERDRILLGIQKNEFGKDRWNGVRGKILDEESAEDAAMR